MNVAFPPPLRWQDFEDLTVEVVRAVFDDPGAQGHGRLGQAQAGVDAYGRERGSGRLVGVQCKHRDGSLDRPAFTLTNRQIREEVQKAEKFKPRLDYFIIATTGSRDADAQSDIVYLQQERIRDQTFPVALWYWEDYVGFLNNDARLNKWYAQLLHSLFGEQLADKQILSVLRTAFSRAAFRTPLHLESSGEFRQALLDTERVVNTGLLLDRETRMPLCRAPGGLADLAHGSRDLVRAISEAVRKTRMTFDAAMARGRIKVSGFYLVVRDPATRSEIDRHRGNALRAFNELLAAYGETPIESPLIATPKEGDHSIWAG